MKNKGITLLALIVTVIIMVILASVSINLITNGGIIEKARTASKDYQYQSDKETWELALASAKDFKTGEINLEKLQEELKDWKIEEKEENIEVESPNKNIFSTNSKIQEDIEDIEEQEEIEEEQKVIVFATDEEIEYLENLPDYQNKIKENPQYDIQNYLKEDKKYSEREKIFTSCVDELTPEIINELYENYSKYEDAKNYLLSNRIITNEEKTLKQKFGRTAGALIIVKNDENLIFYASVMDEYNDGIVNIVELTKEQLKTKNDIIVENVSGEIAIYLTEQNKKIFVIGV